MKLTLALFLSLFSFIPISAQQAPTPPQQAPAISPSTSIPNPSKPAPNAPIKDTPQAGPAQAPSAPDYSQQAFVIQHYKQSVRFENDGTGREELEAQIKINSESGVQALGQLKVGYSALSDQMDIAYVRVRKPDGSLVTAQPAAIQDLTIPDAPVYTDYHQKHISVPSLRPGDVLEYQYVRTIVNPLTPGQFWTSYNFAERGIVLDEQLEINVPKTREIKLKTRPGLEPKITEQGDRRIYRWTQSRLKDDDEDFGKKKPKPPRRDPDEPPSLQLTTYQSWQQLGDWYATLESDRRQPNEAIKAKADSLVQGKTDDMAKVKALYDFVSRDFRYVSLSFGLGRYQPHLASEVINLGYGDCKDKNTLLAALLDAEGYKSTSVLINGQRKLDPDIPSPSQFDHVITRVPVAGQEIWLDSTTGIAPFRMLGLNLRDKDALAMPPGGKPSLVRSPADLPFDAYDRSRIEGSLTDTGKLTAHFSDTVRGDNEMALRFALRQIPNNKWKNLFEMVMATTPMKGGEITNLDASDPSDTDTPLQLDYDIATTNYFDWSSTEARLPLPLTNVKFPEVGEDDDSATKGKPIRLGAPQQAHVDVALTVPSKYTMQLPIGVDVKRDYAEYHSSYKVADASLVASRDLKILVREIPHERREDWAAFRRAIESDQAQFITLENKSPGTSGISATTSADELFDSGTQALNNGNFALAADLLQRVEKTDPNHKGLWTNLGRAYLGLNQNEKAVNALKKQIAANAYDEHAYNDLGVAYQRQQKYDDAIAQFKKQIDINPLDPNAHANLGVLYNTLKKFADAVPELEKAVSITPKNPLLQISLGEAYIATDQTQRGMAAFEKATNVAPNALVWNNIAYTLAEQNVQLARADRYADTAINALETQLRDVALDRVRMQDLGTTNLLFSVWDTKGWVAFKRGEPEVAERYILPAWQGSASGATAEHLGEIYEAQGKRDQAIQYYLLGLTGDSPSVEAKAKLAALNVSNIDGRVDDARKQLKKQTTLKLDATQNGAADFFLLLGPEKVEDVKFIRGDDSLKAFTDILKNLAVPMKFPPSSQGHVVRRATVTCGIPSPAAKPASVGKTKPKSKGGAASGNEDLETNGAAAGRLPGPCTLELIPSGLVRSIE